MPDRASFESRYQALAEEYDGRDVPRPPHWWGYRVVPARIEFWTDRAHRLHERRLFVRAGEDGPWAESLLYP
jgi:pyridoxamine 5'-phosphate oxidase